MNLHELKEVLTELAELDLSKGHTLDNHPCMIAIRALDQCFDDIEHLRKIAKNKVNKKSKRSKYLIELSYSPEY